MGSGSSSAAREGPCARRELAVTPAWEPSVQERSLRGATALYIGEDTSGQGRAWVAGHRIIQLNNTDCINT